MINNNGYIVHHNLTRDLFFELMAVTKSLLTLVILCGGTLTVECAKRSSGRRMQAEMIGMRSCKDWYIRSSSVISLTWRKRNVSVKPPNQRHKFFRWIDVWVMLQQFCFGTFKVMWLTCGITIGMYRSNIPASS